MSEIKDYTDLRIWKLGMEITKDVYHCLKNLPAEERFGLGSQIRKSAISIPSNIAEGHMRGKKAFRYFLRISLGSLAELETQLQLCVELGFINKNYIDDIKRKSELLKKQIHSLHAKLSISPAS